MIKLIRRKPIFVVKESEGAKMFKYKNSFTVYALDIPIEIETDLSQDELDRLCEGMYSDEEIRRFECTGSF